MPKISPNDQENEPVVNTSLNDLIGKQVMRSLGSPKDLLRVRVHSIAADKYRVNVVTGKDYASGKIANSYFLTANDKGEIVTSAPPIVRLY